MHSASPRRLLCPGSSERQLYVDYKYSPFEREDYVQATKKFLPAVSLIEMLFCYYAPNFAEQVRSLGVLGHV